jgi:hypothetical protein
MAEETLKRAPNQIPRACFAPPLTDELLAAYGAMLEALPQSELRDAFGECYAAVSLWWGLDWSSRTDGESHVYVRRDPRLAPLPRPPAGQQDRRTLAERGLVQQRVQETPLEDEAAAVLWDAVPWPRELKAMGEVFAEIPADRRELRDAAHHLLWHAVELAMDREPLTSDRVPALP